MIDNNVLVSNDNYEGQYVILNGRGSKEVVCASPDAEEAYNIAIRMQIKEPVIVYVTKHDEVNIL